MAAPLLLAGLMMFTDPKWGTLRLSGGLDLSTIVSRLRQAKAYRSMNSIHSLSCYRIGLIDDVTQLVVDLLLTPSDFGGRNKLRWDHVEVHSCTGPGVAVIVEVILSRCTVEKLTIRGLRFDSAGLGLAINRGLVFHSNDITNESINRDSGATGGMSTYSDVASAKELRLTVSFSHPGALLSIHNGITCDRSVAVLDLTGCRWYFASEDGFQRCAVTELVEVLRSNSTIRELSLASCCIEDSDMADLVPILVHHSSIHKFNLSGNSCGADFLASMAAQMSLAQGGVDEQSRGLSSLFLTHHELSEERVSGLAAFFESLANPSIRIASLSMGSYMITEADLQALANSLASPTCPIEHLSLRTCGLTTGGIRALAKRLPNVLNLRHLDFPVINSPMDLLLDGIAGNYSLTRLDIGDDANTGMVPRNGRIAYYLDLNRGGRRVLSDSNIQLSVSLWPTVLTRAAKVEYIDSAHAVDVVYSLLRGKMLVEQVK